VNGWTNEYKIIYSVLLIEKSINRYWLHKYNEMKLPKFILSIAESEKFARSALKEDALGKINRYKKMPTIFK